MSCRGIREWNRVSGYYTEDPKDPIIRYSDLGY